MYSKELRGINNEINTAPRVTDQNFLYHHWNKNIYVNQRVNKRYSRGVVKSVRMKPVVKKIYRGMITCSFVRMKLWITRINAESSEVKRDKYDNDYQNIFFAKFFKSIHQRYLTSFFSDNHFFLATQSTEVPNGKSIRFIKNTSLRKIEKRIASSNGETALTSPC